ncbi:hypothetical protein Tco_1294689 [Tanacetum coccineum]
MDEDQARPYPGESRVALAGPNTEPTHDEFMAIVYPKVHESLKFPADQHFFNDKSTEDELGKLNVEAEVVSMVTVPIYQASLSVPPMSTPVPHRDRFRDLPEADMKEMLHQWMFETGSYKSLPEHVALYEALEASMERTQRDEPPAPQSSSWKTNNTREAPSRSSKQQFGPHSEQPVEDIPMPDTANTSDSEDTGSTHLPKIQPRPEWLKPILEEDRPATPEPAWVISTSHIPNAMNNWSML